jgi:hypothetical protein
MRRPNDLPEVIITAPHSRTRSSSCKDSGGSILKYEAFLYIHARLPSGEFVALRMRRSDGHILRCYQHRRTGNACGLQAYRGQSSAATILSHRPISSCPNE